MWGKALVYLNRQSESAASRASLDAALGRAESAESAGGAGGAASTAGGRGRPADLGGGDGLPELGLSSVAMCRLGQTYHTLSDYGRAADYLRRVVASLQGELEREHFEMVSLPAVFARAWLGWCLAELGDFDEGATCGREGISIAEAADHAHSRGLAAWASEPSTSCAGIPGARSPCSSADWS